MSNKRKVLYVITKSNWGGAQRYIFDLATHLNEDQFDVAVATSGQDQLVERLAGSGIRVIPLSWLQRNINVGKELLALVSLIKIFIRERPDVIHLNSSKAGGLGAVAARVASLVTGRKVTVIFTVHGWAFLDDLGSVRRAIILSLSWVSTLFQDTIIVITTRDLAWAERFIPKHKITFIPNGIEPSVFLERNTARTFLNKRLDYRLKSDSFLIGTIAELTRTKGLLYLVEAMALIARNDPLHHYQLVIVGAGEERDVLERTIRTACPENMVFLAGTIPNAARYLRAFDLFILPSVKEGLPYAVLEAMQAGIAVLATDAGGVPDLIENNVSGLIVPPKDPQALAETIAKLSRDPSQRRSYADKARTIAHERFSLDRMIESTLKLYHAKP